MYKDDGDINDENNYRPTSAIDHIVKMIESHVSYQIIAFWMSIVLCQWTNQLIWKDTPPKLAFIDDWLEKVNDCAITGVRLLDISNFKIFRFHQSHDSVEEIRNVWYH